METKDIINKVIPVEWLVKYSEDSFSPIVKAVIEEVLYAYRKECEDEIKK